MTPSTKRATIAGLVFVLLPLACTLAAQEARWRELESQASLLWQQGKYQEAIPLVEEALKVAEATFGAEHLNVARSSSDLAELYRQQGRYGDAVVLSMRALKIREKELGPDHPEVARALNNLAALYDDQARYDDAEPLYMRAIGIEVRSFGPEDISVATSQYGLASLYYKQRRYGDAERYLKSARAIQEKALGPEHPAVAASMNGLAAVYFREGQYGAAEPLFKNALAIREKKFGPEHPLVATSLNNLADLYRAQGRYPEAEPLLKQSLAISQKLLGPAHPDVAICLSSLAGLYREEGRGAEAEPLLKQALEIQAKAKLLANNDALAAQMASWGKLNLQTTRLYSQGKYREAIPVAQEAVRLAESVFGVEHLNVSIAQFNLAEIYKMQGRYPEAEQLYRSSLETYEKARGPYNFKMAGALLDLADLDRRLGNWGEAELLFKRSNGIWLRIMGPNYWETGESLRGLANLYMDEKRYGEAESLLKSCLANFEKTLGSHPWMTTVLNDLALLYILIGKQSEAEPLYRRALAIDEKSTNLPGSRKRVAANLKALVSIYESEGKYSEAERMCKRELSLLQKDRGQNDAAIADAVSVLALLSLDQGRYEESESLYTRALGIREKSFGSEGPRIETDVFGLAQLYQAEGRSSDAGPLLDRSMALLRAQFDDLFVYMSEKERLLYVENLSVRFSNYYSYCVSNRQQAPELAEKMYDVALWEKAFIAQSVASVRGRIEASGDKEALALLDQFSAKKTQLARLLTFTPEDHLDWLKQIEELKQEANDLEKELVRKSASLPVEISPTRVTWREVQKALKPGEAAVEFLRFPYYDRGKQTDLVYYVALVLVPESTQPSLVVLGNAKELEAAPISQYRKGIGGGGEPLHEAPTGGTEERVPVSFFISFWKPMEAALGTANRVYISPDGVLNQVSFSAASLPNGKLLGDDLDVWVVNSTRDLLQGKHAGGSLSAVLIGNPAFDLSDAQQRAAARRLTKSPATARGPEAGMHDTTSRDLRGSGLSPLPGTEAEVHVIDALLRQEKWQVQTYTGEQALKEAILRVHAPRVLHIATHGFFLPEQERPSSYLLLGSSEDLEEPMLRSGLFLAGANRALKGILTPSDLDDGILTAYEAKQINLHGTELVVLSACDTGLGETKAGEGVFGLRRAFQEAGAESILMSMWSVPDLEAQELMTLFYQHWLKGEEKHEALRHAELEEREVVKRRYGRDLPYYWGAFVLVGR